MEDGGLHVGLNTGAWPSDGDGLDDKQPTKLLTDCDIEWFASESARLQREMQLVIPESPWHSTAWIALGPVMLAAVLSVCAAYLN